MFHTKKPLRFFPVLLLCVFAMSGDWSADRCPPANADDFGALRETPWIMKTGPGIFRIGEIQVQKHHQTITFPAVFLPADTTIEHFLIYRFRGEKNSLLSTEVDPGAFNVALMMIGLEGENWGEAVPAALSSTDHGNTLEVEVAHRIKEGYEKNDARRYLGPMSIKWRYRGGFVRDGKYSAKAEGVLMALGQYPGAVVDNAAAALDFRSVRLPEGVPVAGTQVIVTIRNPAP